MIDIAIPGDQNIIMKEPEKIEKYQDLQIELGKTWKLKAEVVPVVVVALGTISLNLKFYLKKIVIPFVTCIMLVEESHYWDCLHPKKSAWHFRI